MIPIRINQSRVVTTVVFVWGAIMYVVGVYTSFFGGALNLFPFMVAGYVVLLVGLHLYEKRYWTEVVVGQGLTQLNKELYDLIVEHKETEEVLGERLRQVREGISYAPLKLLLANITLDTEKHAKLLQSVIDTLSTEQTVPTLEAFNEELDRVHAVMEDHVRIEEEMGDSISRVMASVDSRVLRGLMKTIRDDEVTHHTMFQMVLRTYRAA